MAHLRCAHGRRVIILAPHVVVHRNGDGSRCAEKVTFNGNAVIALPIINGRLALSALPNG